MLPGLGASAAFAIALRDGDQLRSRFAARRDMQAEMDRFRERAAQATDVEALLKDRRSLRVVLEAFQLEGEIGKTAILRKVLTEPLDDPGSLVNRFVDPRYKELATAFAAVRAVALGTSQVAALSTTAVRGLALNEMAGLTASQVTALTTAQVAALDPAQLRAIGSTAIRGLEARDIAVLGTAQVAALRPSQLGALSSAQMAAIATADLAVLGTAQIRGLGSSQLAALTTTQIRALATSQIAALTTTQIGALDATQRAAFTPRQAAALGTSPLVALVNARRAAPAETATPPLQDRALLDRLVDRAMLNRYEKSMGEDNAGLREALYFVRSASKVTSVNALLADTALSTVVRGALGLTDAFAYLDYEQQRDRLARRLDLADFQDPAKVQAMAKRYLALKAPSASTTNPIAGLFDGSGGALDVAALSGRRLSLTS